MTLGSISWKSTTLSWNISRIMVYQDLWGLSRNFEGRRKIHLAPLLGGEALLPRSKTLGVPHAPAHLTVWHSRWQAACQIKQTPEGRGCKSLVIASCLVVGTLYMFHVVSGTTQAR